MPIVIHLEEKFDGFREENNISSKYLISLYHLLVPIELILDCGMRFQVKSFHRLSMGISVDSVSVEVKDETF